MQPFAATRRRPFAILILIFCLAAAFLTNPRATAAQSPGNAQWIWGHWSDRLERPAGERCYFRHEFELPAAPRDAKFIITCDNQFELFINGKSVARGNEWTQPKNINLKKYLTKGKNCIAVEGVNESAPAGLLFYGDVECENNARVRLESDTTVLTLQTKIAGWENIQFKNKAAQPAHAMAPHDGAPWGLVRAVAPWQEPKFETLPGFHVDAVAHGFGSVVAMTIAEGGNRIFASVENGPIYEIRAGAEPQIYTDHVQGSHGLLYDHDVLYAVGNGPSGSGLYTIQKANNSDETTLRLLGKFKGDGGEHGAHGIVRGPDGRLYIAAGNHVQIDQRQNPRSPFQIHYEGHPIPNYVDPLGHAVNIKTPGGTIVSVLPDGTDWQIFAGGFRNHYDLAFNKSGSLFTYDSDMEWDVGLPWYRPVRLLHIVSGGEYGWRTGSMVWPEYYEDSLPAAVEVGRGSPTGIVCYEKDQFPGAFQNSILACDWSRGEILAFNLLPKGVSFTGSYKTLLRGHPLNVTDIEVAADGSVLFSTGGRGTQGGIYRLSYDTKLPGRGMTAGALPEIYPKFDATTPAENLLAAAESSDRFLRFAAMHEMEKPARAAIAPDANKPASGAAMLAAARAEFVTKPASAAASSPPASPAAQLWITIFERDYNKKEMTREWRLAMLRAAGVILSNPAAAESLRPALGKLLLPLFPTGDHDLDHELALLLAASPAPGAVDRLLAQLQLASSRSDQIFLAYCLRNIPDGWSTQQKEMFISWLRKSKEWSGGMSFQGYLTFIAGDFGKLLAPAELEKLRAPFVRAAVLPPPPVAGGTLSPKDLDTTYNILDRSRGAARRSLAEGAMIYQSLCSRCHSCGQVPGRNLGPELTTARGRFSTRDLLDAILQPSRVVSDQYQAWEARPKSGAPVTGLKSVETDREVTLVTADGTPAIFNKSDLAEYINSPVSLMPEGLLDTLTYEQIADLVEFIESQGAAAPATASEWKTVFNSKNLDGFSADAKLWSVENGVIAGRAKGLPGSRFLIIDEMLDDFTIEYDLQIVKGNSGLQFRAWRPDVPDNKYILVGYQADAGESYWGSLYEEGGRGMLAQVSGEIWTSITQRDWNHYVVTATGDHITIELNGYKTVDLYDKKTAKGILGFQLHAGGDNELYIRNIRYKRMSAGQK